MTVNIRVHVHAESAIRRMREMERRSKDFKAVFRWAKKQLQLANSENFSTSGMPVGGWAPLNADYSAWKAVHYPGRPPMQATGNLRASLTTLNGPANKIGLKEAQFGTDVEYARFHQYGTTRMPKRQIVFEPSGFARTLAEHTGKHIVYGRFG